MLSLIQLVHAAYIGFVVTSPALLLYAGLAQTRWLRPLRAAHLLTVAFIAVQYTLDWPCPLTRWENAISGRPADTALLAPLAEHGALIASAVAAYLLVSLAAHAVAWRAPEPT